MSRTGIIFDESNEDYHAHAAVSKTKLDTFRASPLRYKGIHLDKVMEGPSGAALAFGTAGHVFILEGEAAFAKQFMVTPRGGFPQNTNEGKDGLEAFALKANERGLISLAEFEVIADLIRQKAKKTSDQQADWDRILGKFMVTFEDREKIGRIHKSVLANKQVAAILEAAKNEVTFRTPLVKGYGFQAQCRADAYCPEGYEGCPAPIAADLKTIDDVDNIEKNVLNFGYYRAGPFYSKVINALVPENPIQSFPLIFVEKKEPFRCRVVNLDADSWERGASEIAGDMRALGRCLRGELEWEKAERQMEVVGLPDWYLRRKDDRWEV